MSRKLRALLTLVGMAGSVSMATVGCKLSLTNPRVVTDSTENDDEGGPGGANSVRPAP